MSSCGGKILKKNNYAYFKTPPWLVRYAVSLVGNVSEKLSVIEPACATAPFLYEFKQRYGQQHKLTGIDISTEHLDIATKEIPHAKFIHTDFLTWEPDTLYDIVFCNPPYGIIGQSTFYTNKEIVSRKKEYKDLFETWQGKYNVYSAFIEKAIKITKDNGKIIFVVPASWLVLDNFSKLRKYLSEKGRIKIYYFGRVFKNLNVSTVLLYVEKSKTGLELYDGIRLAYTNEEYNGDIIRFENSDIQTLESKGEKIKDLFELHIAARSLEFKKHPCVSNSKLPGYIPVLTGKNLRRNWINYDKNYSNLWIKPEAVGDIREYYTIPHIVVGNTKGIKLIAAVDKGGYAWREEIHMIAKNEKAKQYQKITEILNSEFVNKTLKRTYREFINHVTLTMLGRLCV